MSTPSSQFSPDIFAVATFDDQGLICAVAQEITTGEVLMVAWMNADSLQKTLDSGEAVFWSRSRQALWKKGETSGNVLVVREVLLDCDGDTLLLKVEMRGTAACHTGRYSCFYRGLSRDVQHDEVRPLSQLTLPNVSNENIGDGTTIRFQQNHIGQVISRLDKMLIDRKKSGDANRSYTAKLFAKGDDAILKKIGEEATETVLAAKDVRAGKSLSTLTYECADLWFHSMVMLAQFGLKTTDVLAELESRMNLSGLEEKARRKLAKREADDE